MRKQKLLLLGFMIIISSTVLFSQNDTNNVLKKREIGIQINPYFNRSLFNENTTGDLVFALRYGVILNSGFSTGIEFSGNYFENTNVKTYSLNPGIFIRYSFLKQKKIMPFVESSGYYEFGKTIFLNEDLVTDGNTVLNDNKFAYYFAPGITFPLFKNKILLDFMVKVSTVEFVFGGKIVPSYRLIYLF